MSTATVNYLTSYSRALHEHARCLHDYRSTKGSLLPGFSRVWLTFVKAWAKSARDWRQQMLRAEAEQALKQFAEEKAMDTWADREEARRRETEAADHRCTSRSFGFRDEDLTEEKDDEQEEREPDYDAPRPLSAMENWQQNDEHHVR